MKNLKKTLLFLILTALSLSLFTACDGLFGNKKSSPGDGLLTGKKPPPDISLTKSSFAIAVNYYNVEPHYSLSWYVTGGDAYYTVELADGVKYENYEQNSLTLDPDIFAPDVVHTVKVTAHNADPRGNTTEPVEVKFKGTRLAAPINFRMGVEGLRWHVVDPSDSDWFVYEYNGITPDNGGQKIYTGEKFIGTATETAVYEENIKLDMKYAGMDGLYEVRIYRELAYGTTFEFAESTEVLEFDYPSEYSNTDVKVWAANISNPTNVRWADDLSTDATVCWDSDSSSYGYNLLVYGNDIQPVYSTFKGAGATSGTIAIQSLQTGNYSIGVQSFSNDIDQLNLGAFYAYRFYISQPINPDDRIPLSVNRVILETPKNLRIDGEKIVWDAVDNVNRYGIGMFNLDTENNFYHHAESTELAFSDLELAFSDFYVKYNGNINDIFDIRVRADNYSFELNSFENNRPEFVSYHSSMYGEPTEASRIRLKSIAVAQHIAVDLDDSRVTWDAVDAASKYETTYYYAEGGGHGSLNITNTYDIFSEGTKNGILDGSIIRIVVMAKPEYSLTAGDDGIPVLSVASIAEYLIPSPPQ
ncbi:MAG: hypothetical protein LBP26_03395 [Clostridiales bacterium]|jgi:hypothetical protein|nr:hypothetical protein [Clostridiales bacterium]